MNLGKQKEILIASTLGLSLSLILTLATYFFGDHARGILSEKNADILESYLLIFSGIFIAYVVLSLHNRMRKRDSDAISQTAENLKDTSFDISLFLTILCTILKEGFEIALFTASTALFTTFLNNVAGLFIGFILATLLGLVVTLSIIKIPIRKIFKVTEYAIVLMGASLVQLGITKLLETHFSYNLSKLFPLSLKFLPEEESIPGEMLKAISGLEKDFSFSRISIMLLYFAIIYFLFIYKRKTTLPIKQSTT
jgi:FTR1 family protein